MRNQPQQQVRCAIYTRKSTDEGLEQDFNSLDAQRESGENYIASQKANGWVCLPDRYDDGGCSGGNIERPALKRLLTDIRERKVDMVVVYKLDRLSRSLMDFSELQTAFDEYGVSFVAVTQEINTSTSAGRMMLNILMTFAQYEREIITERIRDKIAAAKKRGKHCGGFPLLGYDSDPVTKKLAVNPKEAETVRFIFASYLKHGSAKAVSTELELRGLKTKGWTTKRGIVHEEKHFNNHTVYRILKSPYYIGRVPHHDVSYPGDQEAILDQETWDKVQLLLKNNMNHDATRRTRKVNPFSGLVFCGSCGGAMTLSHTVKKKNKRYSYYICLEDTKRNFSICPIKRMPANEFEKVVVEEIGTLFQTPTMLAALLGETGQALNTEQLQTVLKNIYGVWEVMCPVERCRLIQTVIKRITVYTNRLKIEPNTEGINTLLIEAGMEKTNG